MNINEAVRIGNIHCAPVEPIGSYDIQATMLGIADLLHVEGTLPAYKTEDIKHAEEEGKEPLVVSLYGCTNIQGRPQLLRAYYEMGVRQIMMCYKTQNNIGVGCDERHQGGAAVLAKKVIPEMVKLGIVIDLAYAARQTQLDLIDLIKEAKGTCIVSSECAAEGEDSSWKLDAAVAEKVAETGGVIVVRNAENLKYYTELVGKEHIATPDNASAYVRLLERVWK